MIRVRLLALAAIALAGAASGAQPLDPHKSQQAAELAMLKCFYTQAASLDDHISPASTIAVGVVSACHPQFDDWKYDSFEELPGPKDASVFYRGMDRAASNLAVQVVLKVRAAAK